MQHGEGMLAATVEFAGVAHARLLGQATSMATSDVGAGSVGALVPTGPSNSYAPNPSTSTALPMVFHGLIDPHGRAQARFLLGWELPLGALIAPEPPNAVDTLLVG
ncbi:hypothetical protein GGX14DRAFT_567999 [Mycena pura]|uniref:Uncharacterized protein n=1 Tax=Mycena pura TaxID=153505 RepID=A0AAD6Y9H0_9AGAR|nr:hypothetical protein GGX14DRAFT_567999 [Mycena pura]